MNICSLLRANAQHNPDKPGIIFENRSLSNHEMLVRTEKLAAGMRAMGLQKGDRLAIYGYNSAEWVITYLAATVAGLIVVPISFRTKPEELRHMFTKAGINGVAFDASLISYIEDLRNPFQNLKYFTMTGEAPSWASSWQQVQTLTDAKLSFSEEPGLIDGQSICFTSGTTGMPKGVLLTQANVLLGQHINCTSVFPFTGADVFVISTPLVHRTGWGRLVQAMGLGATACILPTPFETEELIKVIINNQATVVGMVPTMARMVLQRCTQEQLDGLKSWKAILLTGERCPEDLKTDFAKQLPQVGLYTFYASTETGMISCLGPVHQVTKPSSVGTVVPIMELKLDPEGEILVRSGQPGQFAVMSGYYDDPAASTQVIEDGWYHTGDVGQFDDDGILYIIDRKKDLIITGGLNVSSREVEEIICRHPNIVEAAVVSVPDPLWGEAIRAFCVVKGNVSPDEILKFCDQNLPGYKRPKFVEFIDELPRNTNGKVIKHLLKKIPLQQEVS